MELRASSVKGLRYVERRYVLGMDVHADPDRLVALVQHHFAWNEGENKDKGRGCWLTTNLETEFVQVRQCGPDTLLALYRHSDPVDPRFCVAEMDGSDTGGKHIHDHGPDLLAAARDFQTRQPGQLTATPPEPAAKS